MTYMSENKEYSLIYNWADIESRSNFLSIITINNENEVRNKLSHIIAPYQFKEKVLCGISRCQTKHNYGFLVKLKTGEEIIIGKDCGKKYFGAEFNSQYKLMNILKTESENFKNLEEKFHNLKELKNEYERITLNTGKYGIHKINQAIKKLSSPNEILGYFTIKDISQNIQASGEIWVKIRKTDEEVDNERRLRVESQGYIYDPISKQGEIKIDLYRNERIAKINNFSIVYKSHEIEKLIKYFDTIHRKLKHPKDMKKEDRKRLIKEFRAYKNNISELEEFCIKGNTLLAYDNLIKIKHAIRDDNSKSVYIKWVESLTNHS